MRRLWILLLVMGLLAVLATPASAKVDCDARPNHPTCGGDEDPPPDEEPPADDGPIGMTCLEADAALRNINHVTPVWLPSGQSTQQPGDRGFLVELNNRLSACVDVTSAGGDWTIEVISLGSADGVGLAVGDSVNPGDACWGGCHGDVEATVTAADCGAGEPCIVLTPWIPASEIDACGLWLGDNGFLDGDPQLAFTASYSGVNKMAEPVVIRVTVP